jgi:O-antigen ligase
VSVDVGDDRMCCRARTLSGSDVLLSLGAVFATGTQLRIPELPIGVGETLLAIWGAGRFARWTLGRECGGGPVPVEFACFWLVCAACLSAGALVALHVGVWNSFGAAYDAAALLFAMLLSIALGVDIRADPRRAARLVVLYFYIGVATIAVVGALAFAYREVAQVSFWYGGVRLRGWSNNPNQFAFFALTVIVAGSVIASGKEPFEKSSVVLYGIAVALVAGLLTQSDAFAVAVSLVIAAGAGLYWLNILNAPNTSRTAGYLAVVVVPVGVLLGILWAGADLLALALQTGGTIYDQSAQGATRLSLWRNGITAIGTSPVFGLGPGAHSGTFAPFQGFEAHNTFIDWGMSTGIVGVVAYCAILVSIGRRAVRVRRPAVLLALIAISTFSAFHYVLRHPVYWLMIAVFLGLTQPARSRLTGVVPVIP